MPDSMTVKYFITKLEGRAERHFAMCCFELPERNYGNPLSARVEEGHSGASPGKSDRAHSSRILNSPQQYQIDSNRW